MSGQSQGALTKMAMDPSTIDGNSEAYEFLSENLVSTTTLADNSAYAIRGTRSHAKERVTQSLVYINGSISMNPSPSELDNLLPRILGATESTDIFALDDALPSFNVMIDRVAKVHTYSTCYVNRATFSGTKGRLIELKLDIIGVSETEGAAGSYPAITIDEDIAYVFHEGVLTVQGGTEMFDRFVLTIDNHLEPEWNNSQTATDIAPRDRSITLSVSTPYTSDETALYTTPAGTSSGNGSSAGAAGSLVFTNGGLSTTFAFANLKSIARTPNVSGKRQIRLPLNYRAYTSSTTKELIVTHDSAP